MTADDVKARGYNLDIKNPHVVADDHGDPEELLAKLDAAEQEVGQLCAISSRRFWRRRCCDDRRGARARALRSDQRGA